MLMLLACDEKTRTTDTHSRTLKSARARADFLCGYVLCPTRPLDAAFHIVFQDNSHGLLPGPSDGETNAVVKVSPDDTELWARGCTAKASEARPEWAREVLKERPEWAPKSAPDTYDCGFGQTRVIHVKEGVVLVQVETH